ncbi:MULTISPECIES: virulence factor TspB C-terminal domain-related protein [Burkholderia cepacia complex]|uniref:virulence factor TspB C-terminal domain-related protein n=1 Tax=Burkholderia cepacia complex TaxID=87882 RepID=UPI0012FB6202|nr:MULTISPECIES: virulence factor TspB C-terminal domain-related protein [Burkholderia cepacia complex]MDN7668327.1 virulence factor TspB C-terminal domain-related protein [Burkholderia vietnamiensis]
MFKRVVVMVALVATLFQQNVAHAQALAVLRPVFNGVVNRAIGAGILANMERKGLATAANDAVFQSTMKWVGQAANDATYAGAAVSTVAVVAGAPVWLSTAIGVGAMAAVGAVAWGAYQLTQTGTASAPSLTLSGGGLSGSALVTASQSGSSAPIPDTSHQSVPTLPLAESPTEGALAALPRTSVPGFGELPSTVPFYVMTSQWGLVGGCSQGRDCVVLAANHDAGSDCTSVSTRYGCVASVGASPYGYNVDQYGVNMPVYEVVRHYSDSTDAPVQVKDANGNVISSYQPIHDISAFYPVTENPAYVSGAAGATGNLDQLPITTDMLAQPVPNELTARLADRLWQRASAMPGYDGAPYAAVDPVSVDDVLNSGASPSWSDLVEGVPKAATDSSVNVAPDYYPTPSSGGSGGTTGTTCDPSSMLPGCVPLGQAPTAPDIPASSASISLSPWSIGSVDGTCPSPQTVTILGSDFQLSFDPLCTVVQKLRPLVLALCALAAAYIVATGVSL